MITTIEGNAAGAVRERQYSLNAGVIYGYARPNYLADPSNTLIQAILDGRWGNGDERIQRLERAGYNYAAVQDAVNAVIAHPPLFMIAKTAKRWATGEWLANWVKGQTFSVKQTRYNQGQREYLLMNGTVPLGWIKATDGQIKV
ncbi:MAG: hypothetical protein Q4A55_02740 [Aerococcus sp.]|nr:hypothetical protein [Aerococcus sp.]